MPVPFRPRLDILPAPQRRLWDELGDVPREFTLYGGTAIALHLGHRQSVDFDFFGGSPFKADQLLASLPFLAGSQILQNAPSSLTCAVDRGGLVKVSFFGVPKLNRLQPPHITPVDHVRVASIHDLAGTKLSVLQMRAELKDYLDIDAIICSGLLTLAETIVLAQAIYGDTFNGQNALKALCYFEDGDVASLPGPAKQRIRGAVAVVELDRLPRLADILAHHG